MNFQCKAFKDLSIYELYAILKLREEVFIVEQNCVYNDLDNKDLKGHHVFYLNEEGVCLATTRILELGVSYPDYTSIGRVAIHYSLRGKGVGKDLMSASIEYAQKLYPAESLKISAQEYLEDFYKSFGFQKSGAGYLEDGIPHIPMVLP